MLRESPQEIALMLRVLVMPNMGREALFRNYSKMACLATSQNHQRLKSWEDYWLGPPNQMAQPLGKVVSCW
jgi:hypothetical protein